MSNKFICSKCHKKFNKVKDIFGTILCFECYSGSLEDELETLRTKMFDSLPQETQQKLLRANIIRKENLYQAFDENLIKTKAKEMLENE